MILPLLILVLLAGGLAAWALSRWSVSAGRWAALAALTVDGWLLLDAAQPAPSE